MRKYIVLVLCATVLAACGGTDTPATGGDVVAPTAASAQAGASSDSAYPGPDKSYPGPDSAYPGPQFKEGPAFTINPLSAGDTEVTGTGPANVPIRLLDVSQYGEIFGETTIGEDGTFRVPVENGRLVSGNQLAIQLGSLNGTGLNPDDFKRGPNYEDMPYIGIIFTRAVIQ